MPTVAVILAAGPGRRMKSSLPKVLHPILGDPALLWVLRSLPPSIAAAIVVVHSGKEQVITALDRWAKEGLLPCPTITVDQGELLGTGHAVQVATPELDRLGAERVLILRGDMPLLEAATLERLASAPAMLLATDLEHPGDHGRVIQNEDGTLAALVESEDASHAIRALRRVNAGVYSLPWRDLRPALAELRSDNVQAPWRSRSVTPPS